MEPTAESKTVFPDGTADRMDMLEVSQETKNELIDKLFSVFGSANDQRQSLNGVLSM